jgi:hypothetical protein
MVTHNLIVICIEGVIVGKLTLVLVESWYYSTQIQCLKVFATNLGHPIRTMDPSRILLPNGQVHITNLFMKYVLVNFQDWKLTLIFKFGRKMSMMSF